MIEVESDAAWTRPSTPPLSDLAAILDAHAERFVVDPLREGVDVRCSNVIDGKPNRARVKAFVPKPGILVIFLYKDSQVPFSDDRFSYGALTVKQKALPQSEIAEAIAYALSGLNPQLRPDAVKRTFPFTVPR